MESKEIFPVPSFFQELVSTGCLTKDALQHTSDGFWAVTLSLIHI